MQQLVQRNDLDPALIDDVVMGCVMQVGEQSLNVARNAVLAAGWPDTVPGTTVDRQCGSSQQAIQFAAQAVMSGTQDVVIASGVESMTRVPMGSNVTLHMKEGLYHKADGIEAKWPGINFSQFMGAEMIVKKHGFTKDDLDRFAYESHQKAIAATKAGAFDNEIVGVDIETPEGAALHQQGGACVAQLHAGLAVLAGARGQAQAAPGRRRGGACGLRQPADGVDTHCSVVVGSDVVLRQFSGLHAGKVGQRGSGALIGVAGAVADAVAAGLGKGLAGGCMFHISRIQEFIGSIQ
jgi:acetyl-CoA acetyltransferase